MHLLKVVNSRLNFSVCELSHRYSSFYWPKAEYCFDTCPSPMWKFLYVSELWHKNNIKIKYTNGKSTSIICSKEFGQSGNDLTCGGRSHLVWSASSEDLVADHYIVKQQNHQTSLWSAVTLQKLRTSSLPQSESSLFFVVTTTVSIIFRTFWIGKTQLECYQYQANILYQVNWRTSWLEILDLNEATYPSIEVVCSQQLAVGETPSFDSFFSFNPYLHIRNKDLDANRKIYETYLHEM